MQINNSSARSVARLYSRQAAPADQGSGLIPARQAAGRPRTDSVSVSVTRQEVARFSAVVAEQPDVRTDRVASLKSAVASGAYQVDQRALAAAMLG